MQSQQIPSSYSRVNESTVINTVANGERFDYSEMFAHFIAPNLTKFEGVDPKTRQEMVRLFMQKTSLQIIEADLFAFFGLRLADIANMIVSKHIIQEILANFHARHQVDLIKMVWFMAKKYFYQTKEVVEKDVLQWMGMLVTNASNNTSQYFRVIKEIYDQHRQASTVETAQIFDINKKFDIYVNAYSILVELFANSVKLQNFQRTLMGQIMIHRGNLNLEDTGIKKSASFTLFEKIKLDVASMNKYLANEKKMNSNALTAIERAQGRIFMFNEQEPGMINQVLGQSVEVLEKKNKVYAAEILDVKTVAEQASDMLKANAQQTKIKKMKMFIDNEAVRQQHTLETFVGAPHIMLDDMQKQERLRKILNVRHEDNFDDISNIMATHGSFVVIPYNFHLDMFKLMRDMFAADFNVNKLKEKIGQLRRGTDDHLTYEKLSFALYDFHQCTKAPLESHLVEYQVPHLNDETAITQKMFSSITSKHKFFMLVSYYEVTQDTQSGAPKILINVMGPNKFSESKISVFKVQMDQIYLCFEEALLYLCKQACLQLGKAFTVNKAPARDTLLNPTIYHHFREKVIQDKRALVYEKINESKKENNVFNEAFFHKFNFFIRRIDLYNSDKLREGHHMADPEEFERTLFRTCINILQNHVLDVVTNFNKTHDQPSGADKYLLQKNAQILREFVKLFGVRVDRKEQQNSILMINQIDPNSAEFVGNNYTPVQGITMDDHITSTGQFNIMFNQIEAEQIKPKVMTSKAYAQATAQTQGGLLVKKTYTDTQGEPLPMKEQMKKREEDRVVLARIEAEKEATIALIQVEKDAEMVELQVVEKVKKSFKITGSELTQEQHLAIRQVKIGVQGLKDKKREKIQAKYDKKMETQKRLLEIEQSKKNLKTEEAILKFGGLDDDTVSEDIATQAIEQNMLDYDFEEDVQYIDSTVKAHTGTKQYSETNEENPLEPLLTKLGKRNFKEVMKNTNLEKMAKAHDKVLDGGQMDKDDDRIMKQSIFRKDQARKMLANMTIWQQRMGNVHNSIQNVRAIASEREQINVFGSTVENQKPIMFVDLKNLVEAVYYGFAVDYHNGVQNHNLILKFADNSNQYFREEEESVEAVLDTRPRQVRKTNNDQLLQASANLLGNPRVIVIQPAQQNQVLQFIPVLDSRQETLFASRIDPTEIGLENQEMGTSLIEPQPQVQTQQVIGNPMFAYNDIVSQSGNTLDLNEFGDYMDEQN